MVFVKEYIHVPVYHSFSAIQQEIPSESPKSSDEYRSIVGGIPGCSVDIHTSTTAPDCAIISLTQPDIYLPIWWNC